MATRRVYYDDPAAGRIEARVVSIETGTGGAAELILDATVFYPEGGGQPCDTGTIAGFPLQSAAERGEDVAHLLLAGADELHAAGLVPGSKVECVVGLERRHDHAVQHTAQHLLSSVIMRVFGGATLSFHLGERYSSIDTNLPVLERADYDAVEDEVLKVIRDDYKVVTHLCPPEDPSSFPLRKEPSVETGVLRVVEIDGIEYSACCGTHVTGTGALGAFRLLKAEKYKGGSRLSFIAGSRAFKDYRRLARIAREAAAAAGVPDDELPAALASCKEKNRTLELVLDDRHEFIAGMIADGLNRGQSGSVVISSAGSVDEASRLVRALASLGRVSVVACARELKVVAGSPAVPAQGFDIGALCGPLAKAHNGKGGGGRTFFQAAFPDSASLDTFVSAIPI
jgi:alanyl-tRNA synthetase